MKSDLRKAQNLNLFFHWGDDSLKPLINNRTVVNNSGILNIQAFKNSKYFLLDSALYRPVQCRVE